MSVVWGYKLFVLILGGLLLTFQTIQLFLFLKNDGYQLNCKIKTLMLLLWTLCLGNYCTFLPILNERDDNNWTDWTNFGIMVATYTIFFIVGYHIELVRV